LISVLVFSDNAEIFPRRDEPSVQSNKKKKGDSKKKQAGWGGMKFSIDQDSWYHCRKGGEPKGRKKKKTKGGMFKRGEYFGLTKKSFLFAL